MTEVESIAAVWRDRARVAEDAAVELDRLVQAAASTVHWNYFGTDCAEGETLFAQLGASLASWRAEVEKISEAARSVAVNCLVAADSYTLADEAGS